MRMIPYRDANAFHRDVFTLLAQNEVENNLPLGILNRGVEGGAGDGWFMARLEDAGKTALVSLMTPPHNLILASPDRSIPLEAIRLLAGKLMDWSIVPPGVIAERDLSIAFAERYAAANGRGFDIATDERLYRLDRVEAVPVVGTLRVANERDMHYLPYWMKGFADECFRIHAPLDTESARWCVGHGTMYILEDDGQPVSMAGSSRQMPHGRAIGPVYTPPYLRGRGYATACVALLSQRLLDMGNEYCALFTDLANPVSNSIYQKIGYRPLCDYAEIRFA